MCIYVGLTGLVVQLEIVVCQAGYSAVTSCIQLGCCKDVSQGVVISINVKGQLIQIFVEFFNYHPLEDEKFQLVFGVVGFSLVQAATGIGYYSICAILAGLVENSSQARPTGISVELERLGEICIGKNRYSGNSLFRSSKASWHLLSYWMAAFF